MGEGGEGWGESEDGEVGSATPNSRITLDIEEVLGKNIGALVLGLPRTIEHTP